MSAPAFPDDRARRLILSAALAGAALFGAALAIILNSQGA